MPSVDLTVEVPPMPEGWRGTPDELWEFFKENAIFRIDGDFPAGQIGGARPTEDVGIWYGDYGIEKYRDGKYQPISDVPVSALMPWASPAAEAPENWLICDGSSVLRADYPELYAIIGATYGTPESATTFKLPDLRGRVPVGAGIGDYTVQGLTGGKMKERAVGSYDGHEWITRTADFPAGSPKSSMKDIINNSFGAAKKKYAAIVQPMVAMNWIIRCR